MNPKKQFFTIFILVFSSKLLLAQKINGIIIDSDTKKPVPYVNISQSSTQKGVTSDFYGLFQIEANLKDTLIFSSVGYHTMSQAIHNYDTLLILLPPHSYYINEVKVKAEEDIPMMYKSTVFPEGDPGVGAAIASPLSYWYYKLSKTEKSKRKVRSLMDYEKRMAKVIKIYTKDLVAEFSGLDGQALDSCYAFCNANIDLVENDDEFTIKFKLLKVLTDFNKAE